jgi:hypothetical protein
MSEQQYFSKISSNRIRLRWTENKKRFSKSISYGSHRSKKEALGLLTENRIF